MLALLPLIGYGVWLDGQSYDPGLLDFKQAGVRLSPMVDFLPERVGGLARQGEARRFGKENLHDYVNGHAEFFIGAGFKELIVGEYGDGTRPGVVVDLYDMDKPLFAFGVVTQETQPDAQPVAIGEMGSGDARGLRFIFGPYYIKMTAFAEGAPLEEIGKLLINNMGKVGGGVRSFAFPEWGRPTATRFIKDNYRGLDFFDHVVERTFQWEGREVQGFLVGEGRGLEQRLTAFLAREGIPVKQVAHQGLMVTVVDDPYEGTWFFLRDREQLLGAFGLPLEAALGPLQRFVEHGGQTQSGKK
ncbi:DUF6599 family protein [Candidatus Magnetominusculus xianensis]|uniref:DUF6599 family protein n=1 Tax=Candidatus Magnetominusculus xianensis TaxID=1748249 RepID=UPI001F212DE9|nr:DUF6599 family protein [Candidatus Magnetominusculus xianensis]